LSDPKQDLISYRMRRAREALTDAGVVVREAGIFIETMGKLLSALKL